MLRRTQRTTLQAELLTAARFACGYSHPRNGSEPMGLPVAFTCFVTLDSAADRVGIQGGSKPEGLS